MSRRNRFGQLPPRYRFALNPWTDYRAARCPRCNGLTHPRKFALLIHVDSDELRVLGKTCKYCSKCEFIIAHQDEIEAELAAHFEQMRPNVIGNDYRVLGTVERKAWREGLAQPKAHDQVLAHTADFKEYLEIEYQPGGWYPAFATLDQPTVVAHSPKRPLARQWPGACANVSGYVGFWLGVG
jgi:hypothetical protein